MAFNWAEYLRLVEELSRQPAGPVDQEARLRSSISRAYYAAFCSARNHLQAQGVSLSSTGKVHDKVPRQFRSHSASAARRIAMSLDRLRANRAKADYDDAVSHLPRLVSFSLAWSARVLADLEQL